VAAIHVHHAAWFTGALIGNLVTFLAVGFLLEPMIGIGWFSAIYFSGGFAGAIASMMLNGPETPVSRRIRRHHGDAGGPVRLEFSCRSAAPHPDAAGGCGIACSRPHTGRGAWRRGDGRQCPSRRLPGGRIYRLFMLIAWNDENETPPGRSVAAIIAGFWVVMTGWAFAASSQTYVAYARPGLEFIPPERMPKDVDTMKADSLSLVDNIPRIHEPICFAACICWNSKTCRTPSRSFATRPGWGEASPVMTREFQDWNRALLALTVRVQTPRTGSQKHCCAALCADQQGLDLRTRQTLEITKICLLAHSPRGSPPLPGFISGMGPLGMVPGRAPPA